jgi:UDP-glucose 4-epimerase
MKLAGEMLVRDYSSRYGFEHVIVRPSAVYGERDLPDRVIAKFIISAMRNQPITVKGHQERLDFTHVTDTARGIVEASLSDNAANKVYNITRGVGRSLVEAASLVQSIVGQGNIKIEDRDSSYPSRGSLDITAARQDFGFCPTVDLEEGIQNYYHWLKDSFFWNP